MGHLPSLISDLALILITAAITTLLFKKIKQPLVLGYIIAGILVGPHLSLTPTVVDTENIKTLAEIGVIFLLFSLGLEFSFRKLKRVGGSSSITAVFEILGILTLGFFLGKAMGWHEMDSLFLGGMLASSSTTIIIKAFEDLKVKTKNYAKVVFGVLVIEDIVVIMLMVMLSTIAVTKQIEGMELLYTVAKLVFFLVLWFVIGIFIIPTFLKHTSKLLDEETLLVLSIGLCLLMVVLATKAGFSAELGAFIMGSIIAETTSAEKVEHLIKPVKNLFGAVFFVSIGMLIDPLTIFEYRWPVIWVTLLVIFGKLIFTLFGALVSGQPLKQSVQVGMSMAQIGEFAFIVATLGLSLGVTSEFLFPVAVGVSAITTFTTPFMIRYSGNIYDTIIEIIPKSWLLAIEKYSQSTQQIRIEKEWKKLARKYLQIIATNGLMIIAIISISLSVLVPLMDKYIDNPAYVDIISFLISLFVLSPFLWALMFKRPLSADDFNRRWVEDKSAKWPLLFVSISRVVLGLLVIQFLSERIFSTTAAFLFVVPLSLLIFFLSSKRISNNYHRIENWFYSNLNEREIVSTKVNEVKSEPSPFAPDIHIVDMEVNPGSQFVGVILSQLSWREKYGINIAYIERGEKLLKLPGKDIALYPFDKVGIIGTDSQIDAFKKIFEAECGCDSDLVTDDIISYKLVVDQNIDYSGKKIRETPIYSDIKGIVIRIERSGEAVTNPTSDTILEKGDIICFVGEREKINKYLL